MRVYARIKREDLIRINTRGGGGDRGGGGSVVEPDSSRHDKRTYPVRVCEMILDESLLDEQR